MTAIIKAAEAASLRIRPLSEARLAPEARPGPDQVIPVEVLALRRQLEVLTREFEQQRQDLERSRAEVARAYRVGEAEGRKHALKESDERREEALQCLGRGVERALASFAAELKSLETLAGSLAREALEKLIGGDEDRAGLLARLIRRQLEPIERQSLITVHVARADFPDESALAALVTAIGKTGLDLRADGEIEPGGCRVKLALGELDIGLGQQWGRLRAALEAMTAGDGGV